MFWFQYNIPVNTNVSVSKNVHVLRDFLQILFAYILLIICTCAIKVTFNFEHTFPSRITFPWMNCVMCGNFWCCYTTAIFSSMPTQILHSFPFKLLIPNLIHVVRNTNTDWIKCSVNKYFENLHPVILWKFIAIHITHFIWYVVIITEIFYAIS